MTYVLHSLSKSWPWLCWSSSGHLLSSRHVGGWTWLSETFLCQLRTHLHDWDIQDKKSIINLRIWWQIWGCCNLAGQCGQCTSHLARLCSAVCSAVSSVFHKHGTDHRRQWCSHCRYKEGCKYFYHVLSLFLMTRKTSPLVNALTTSKLTRSSSFWRLISCIHCAKCSEYFAKESVLLRALWRIANVANCRCKSTEVGWFTVGRR
jgi:hypothetical protein